MDYVLSSDLYGIKKSTVFSTVRKNQDINQTTLYTKTGAKSMITLSVTTNRIPSAKTFLQTLKKKFNKIMGKIDTDHAERYLMQLISNHYPYQEFSQYRNIVDVKIKIELIWEVTKSPIKCLLIISKYL